MMLKLSKEDIKKIISTISLEDIESRLDYNWECWEINDCGDYFELTKKEAIKEVEK